MLIFHFFYYLCLGNDLTCPDCFPLGNWNPRLSASSFCACSASQQPQDLSYSHPGRSCVDSCILVFLIMKVVFYLVLIFSLHVDSVVTNELGYAVLASTCDSPWYKSKIVPSCSYCIAWLEDPVRTAFICPCILRRNVHVHVVSSTDFLFLSGLSDLSWCKFKQHINNVKGKNHHA